MPSATRRRSAGRGELLAGLALLAAFALWTALVQCVDVRPVGQNGTDVGFAALNVWFHELTGVHMGIYLVTDWLGLVPIAVCLCFGVLGAVQLVRRRSLLRVDADLLLLGAYYILVVFGYLVFEMSPVNYRPIPIDGMMEASYPSSTTLLVLSVMPTLKYQVDRRAKSLVLRGAATVFAVGFSALMVLGRLVAGVHWATDIVGAALLAAGLFMTYRSAVAFADRRRANLDTEGRGWSSARSCRS
ncbi:MULTISPECIES: phosphatase PAP2 family protein [unclassified Adlercreutzia]|uniref:phosphatase PAP2 family protein n=1 Tax=unclassified Adlercreutzia TaxID=2636013 RepID=UPI0013EB5767|nr:MULTISPECIES: phosphatase PAP2 family protein [unclassified Adlercreutzia]